MANTLSNSYFVYLNLVSPFSQNFCCFEKRVSFCASYRAGSTKYIVWYTLIQLVFTELIYNLETLNKFLSLTYLTSLPDLISSVTLFLRLEAKSFLQVFGEHFLIWNYHIRDENKLLWSLMPNRSGQCWQ